MMTVSPEDKAKIELVTEILANAERRLKLPVDTELDGPERVERIREELCAYAKDDTERGILKNTTTKDLVCSLYAFWKQHDIE
jgi:hypothetical protein